MTGCEISSFGDWAIVVFAAIGVAVTAVYLPHAVVGILANIFDWDGR